MANEDSAFWEGVSTGDAAGTLWNAPYSALEYSDIYSKFFGSNSARGYVIPGYNNNLAITANSPVALNVLVATGAALIRGRIYENVAQQTLTIGAADATNPRLDRILIRIDFAAQTIRLVVLQGTAAATPSLPALTQNAITYEISLAYVWVAATATTIAATEIHDERVFAANFESLLDTLLQPNLLNNSEFMAFSRLDSSGTTNPGPPDGGWNLVGTVTTYANLTKPAQMSRGRAIKITTGAATSGISQPVRVKASTVYSIKGLIQVTAGDAGQIIVTTNSASPSTITRNIRRTGSWLEINILYTTESDASTLTLSLLGLNNTDIVDFGQWLIVGGYVPGSFRQIRETIYFDWLLSDPDFDLDTFAASSTTTIDMDTDYQGIVLPGTKAVGFVLYLSNTDTSGNSAVGLRPVGASVNYVEMDVRGHTNSYTFISQDMWIPLNVNNAFDLRIDRGAGTMTVGLFARGIVT